MLRVPHGQEMLRQAESIGVGQVSNGNALISALVLLMLKE